MSISPKKTVLLLFSLIFTSQFILSEINRDLELEAVYHQINLTRTHTGAEKLHHLLFNPTDNIDTLLSRQSAIAQILENEEFYGQISFLLSAFSKNETALERISQPSTEIEAAFLDDLYFSHDSLKKYNHDPLYLELGQLAYFGNLCSSLVQHALAFAIFTWGLEEDHSAHCSSCPPKEDKHDHAKKDADKNKNHDHKDKHHDKDKKEKHAKHDHGNEKCNDSNCTQSHHHHDHSAHHHHKKPSNPFQILAQSPGFRKAFGLWHGVAQIQELYAIQGIVRNHLKNIMEIQTQLMEVARSIRIMHHTHALLEKHPQLNIHITHYQDLKNICSSTHISDKLAACLQLLQTKTFRGKPSAFSRIGIILAAYKLLQEVADELQPAINAMGEVDSYLSCAQLVKEQQSESLQYTFAEYVTEAQTPQLSAYNMWHPLSTSENIQLNSIDLGFNNRSRNIIVTGPNASGKSTNLKAITLCAYLAQTLTIVPAQKYSHSMFKEIYSSMVVTDNLSENMSLFVAELDNAEKLLTKIENLQQDEYMLIVLDELFKSTHHEKGKAVAYRLLQHLYQSKNVITLVSTHFENLAALADRPENNCCNYTLDNFKLVPGIGSSDNAFEMVKKQTRSRLLI